MRLIPALLAALLAQAAAPQSPFDGVWVMDVRSTLADAPPDRFALGRGMFSRGDGEDRLTVRADGRFHRLASDGYVDAAAVRVLGPRHIEEIDRLNGKTVYTVSYAVSRRGDTMTRIVRDFSKPDGRPIATTVALRRIGRARRTGSRITGRWKTVGLDTSQAHLTEEFHIVAGRFRSVGPGGMGYDAIIGGPSVPMTGDAPDARIAVSMPDDRTVLLDMRRDDQSGQAVAMTMRPDGRTIDVAARRVGDGLERHWTLHKR